MKASKWDRTDEHGRRTRVRRGFTRSLRRELAQRTGLVVEVGFHWRDYHAELCKVLFRNEDTGPSFDI